MAWPIGVVDGLEAVEVEEEHRDGGAFAFGACEGLLAELLEHVPVGEPRQRVVRRLVLELGLRPLQLADVVARSRKRTQGRRRACSGASGS